MSEKISNKNMWFAGFVGLVIGIVLTALVGYLAMPGMMMLETPVSMSFDQAVETMQQSVKAHGWQMPAVHDLQKSMSKHGYNVRPAKVFELCKAPYAHEILKQGDERIVASMMPCRVAIYEKPDGKTYISRMNTSLMAGMMGGIIEEVMAKASSENERILEPLLR